MNDASQQPPIGEMIKLSVRATESLYSFASSKVCPVFRTGEEQTHYSGAVMTTYNRMTMWMHDLSIVVEPIHVQLAGVSHRSVFEHLLDLKWLIMHPESAEAFSAFTFIRRFDTADRIKDELDKNPGFDQSPFTAQLRLANDACSRNVRDDQCQKHGWKRRPKHWWMESAEQRARTLGEKYVKMYLAMYSMTGNLVHPGGTALVGVSARAIASLFISLHQFSQESFLEATSLVCSNFPVARETIDEFHASRPDHLAQLSTGPHRESVVQGQKLAN